MDEDPKMEENMKLQIEDNEQDVNCIKDAQNEDINKQPKRRRGEYIKLALTANEQAEYIRIQCPTEVVSTIKTLAAAVAIMSNTLEEMEIAQAKTNEILKKFISRLEKSEKPGTKVNFLPYTDENNTSKQNINWNQRQTRMDNAKEQSTEKTQTIFQKPCKGGAPESHQIKELTIQNANLTTSWSLPGELKNGQQIDSEIRDSSTKQGKQGNGIAAMLPSYKNVAAMKNIVGRKNIITITDQTIHRPQEAQINQELMKTLTIQHQQPITQEIVAHRFHRITVSKEMTVSKWRQLLKENKVPPISIYTPFKNTLEILVHKNQEEQLLAFFATIDRLPEQINPYIRRDGKSEPLAIESIQRTAMKRINWIQYERTAAGMQYLISTIQQASQYLDENHAQEVEKELNHQLQIRKWNKVILNQSVKQ